MFQVYVIPEKATGNIILNGKYEECLTFVNNLDKGEREQYKEIHITSEGKIINRVCIGCGLIMPNIEFHITPVKEYCVCRKCHHEYLMQELKNINK